MPIIVDSEIHVLTEREFHEQAEKVIGIVFDVHNQFGRLMNEEAYKRIIQTRCEQAGMTPARREVEIIVQHGTFEKRYYMDLLLTSSLMTEAKTAEKLTKSHEAQTLHYLLLTEMQHGLLVNLRPKSVEKKYVSTQLDLAKRQQFSIVDTFWNPINEASNRLRAVMTELLNDWGAFLNTSLYREAVVHFFGGPEIVLRPVPVYDRNQPIGTHPFCLLADDTAFAITALTSDQSAMQEHLLRLLSHTKLACVQWINMHHHDIEFRTVTRTTVCDLP